MTINDVTIFTPRNHCRCNCIVVKMGHYSPYTSHCDVGLEANPNLSEDQVLSFFDKYPEAVVIFANYIKGTGGWEIQLAL